MKPPQLRPRESDTEEVRQFGDFYPTDPRLCDAICAKLRSAIGSADCIVEPSAGDGSFVRAARKQWPHSLVLAVEPFRPPELLDRAGADLIDSRTWEAHEWISHRENTLILGNPPFDLAERHVALAMERLGHATLLRDRYLAFLLLSSFAHGEERFRTLFHDKPSVTLFGPGGAVGGLRYFWPLVQRPSFQADGASDGRDYAVFVWQCGYRGKPEMDWLSWR